MMPLTIADSGKELIIKKVGGSPEIRKHLETLGFVEGGTVVVVNMVNGNVIVNVKGSRIGIAKEMANKIMV